MLKNCLNSEFQHTAARRRLKSITRSIGAFVCFNTQPPEGGCFINCSNPPLLFCFNTQPPEGGCLQKRRSKQKRSCFNTQPPEGGCQLKRLELDRHNVSTHSRPKAAVEVEYPIFPMTSFQHTAARRRLHRYLAPILRVFDVSTHSRPKAAAQAIGSYSEASVVSTHSRPKAAVDFCR